MRPPGLPDLLPCGIGLRAPHYREVVDTGPRLGWLEVHSENFFGDGGQPHYFLERCRALYPLSLHGVGLALGSCEPLDLPHVGHVRRLAERYDPFVVSDHLCWGAIPGRHLNDLLPLPFTEEALAHLASRVMQAQELLGRQILVENVSSYLQFTHSTIPEWEFVTEVSRRSGCGILLDVNNVYVSAVNHGFDAYAYLRAIPGEAVGEIHLAGFDASGPCLIDTHGTPVCEAVWELYSETVARIGPKPTLIEWDTDIPPLHVMLAHAQRADNIMEASDAQPA